MLAFFERSKKVMLTAYLLGAGYFLLAIDTDENGVFTLVLKWIAAPTALVVIAAAYHYRNKFESRLSLWVCSILFYCLLVVASAEYVSAMNAVWMAKNEVVFEGPILSKHIHGWQHRILYDMTILDKSTGKEMAFDVNWVAYTKYNVGDNFRRVMHKGRLGILYRWRF